MSQRLELQHALQAAAVAVAQVSSHVRMRDPDGAVLKLANALRAIHRAQEIATKKEGE